MRDLKFAWRRLSQAPLFTLFSVVTLALGIGVVTAVYSFLYAALWRDSGVPDPDRVVFVSQAAAYTTPFSAPEFRDLVEQQTAFASIAAWRPVRGALAANGSSRLVHGEAVTGDYFRVLGIEATLGRAIRPADDHPGSPAVIVLSDAVWRAQFAGDPAVLGTSVRMAGHPFEVVGVMPPAAGQWRPGRQPPEMWVPLASAPGSAEVRFDPASRESRRLSVVGRLGSGHTVESATAELSLIGQRLEALSTLDRRLGQARRVYAAPAFGTRTTSVAENEIGRLILALPALVLLIACTNLANLVLSRGVSRRHEFAVRRALGASRWQLVREQLIEGALIAVAGGLGGVLVTNVIIQYVLGLVEATFGSWPEYRIDAHLEPTVLAAAGLAALLALVVSSLVPAMQLTKVTVRNALASDTPQGALPRWRGRSNLIALQVAASVGLFLIAALFVRGVLRYGMTDSGPDLDRVALVSIPFLQQQQDEVRIRETIDRIVTAVQRAPGVEGVAVTELLGGRSLGLPLIRLTSPDKPIVPKVHEGEITRPVPATPEFFKLVGRSVRFGRGFDDRDYEGAPPVALVNESLARKVFGVANACGREIVMHSDSDRRGARLPEPRQDRLTIVGIIDDRRDERGRIDDEMYVPFAQAFTEDVSILARSETADATTLTGVLTSAVREVDPDLAVGFAGPAAVAMRFRGAAILGMFTTAALALAGLALVLAMAGLYGVLSHVVARRTRELGLRMALGADGPRIMRLILKDGFRPVIEGAFIGCASAALIRIWLQPYFQMQVTSVDPLAIVIGVGPLFVAAAVACYLPARRAAKVDPNVALREL